MKTKYSFLIAILGIAMSIHAQTDVENTSTQIPVEENQDAEKDNVTEDSPFDKPIEIPDFKPEEGEEDRLSLPVSGSVKELDYKREKGFSMDQQSTLIDPGVIFEKRWEDRKKQIALAEDRSGDFRRNQNLGTFRTREGKVDVVYRDHQYPDGDRIMVLVNDDIIRSNVLLHTGYSGFNLNLEPGINKIDFVALNQGESGPNTAYIAVYDENGTLISANEWNLATGFRATIVVVKEKTME
ncbi:MAG: hypothetical protein HKP06_12705 [Flavobacteriaceae bacterium]|nr:hypothetical protein [Flavobacteriaceae bacterium]